MIAMLLVASVWLILTIMGLAEEQRLRTNRIWTQQADLMRGELGAGLINSLAYSMSAIANGDVRDGPRGPSSTPCSISFRPSISTGRRLVLGTNAVSHGSVRLKLLRL